ncbi:hypothetical protein LJC23_05075 [Desulfovibrio sp. OttesenSCG-928-I05]|nr:hypothetical protein [Desulfovibrio sp. OttesenSCG-928-I05]
MVAARFRSRVAGGAGECRAFPRVRSLTPVWREREDGTIVPQSCQQSWSRTAISARDVKTHIVPEAGHGYDSVPQQDELFSVSMAYLDKMTA